MEKVIYTQGKAMAKIPVELLEKKEYKTSKTLAIANLSETIKHIKNNTFVGTIYINQAEKVEKKLVGFGLVLGDLIMLSALVRTIFEEHPEVLADLTGLRERDNIGVG